MTENAQREMTLREWVERLPASHLARREYDALTTPPAAQVQQEAVGHIIHSADAVSRFDLTPAGLALGYGSHPVYAHPAANAPGAVRELEARWLRLSRDEALTVPERANYLGFAGMLQSALAQAPAIRGAGLSDPMALRMALDEARNILGPEKFEGIAIMFREQDALIDSLQEALAQAPAGQVTDEMVKDAAKAIDDLHVEMTEASIGDEVATQFARAALEAAHGQGKAP